jgi:C4-dicarboxylate-specific signal transduction histidine kinase
MSSKKRPKSGSKKNSSSKKEKKDKEKAAKPEVAVAEPVHFLLYYFCCFCILPKKFRKDKRRIEREKRAQQDAVEETEVAVDDGAADLKAVDPKVVAATKIQAMVRGYQAKEAMKEYWQDALHEASQHWLQIVRARELAWLERERAIVARKQVSVVVS